MRISDRKVSFNDLINDGLNAKWKVIHLILSIIFTPYYMLMFYIKGIKWGNQWRLYGLPVIHKYKGSEITIGKGFTARTWFSSNPLGLNKTFISTLRNNSKIIIGDNVGISGVTICASDEIKILNNTLIGANTKIFDSDFHSLNYKNRGDKEETIKIKGVYIGENVLIGTNCLILKGVNIGNNSIIGAGSVVISSVEKNTVYSGNPAKFIKSLD